MLQKRLAADRGHGQHGWLDTHYTFSFSDYYDPENMGFRVLRVMNEDRIAPSMGFGMHSHRDMEIITYVLEGALAHRDSLGTGEVLRPGEFQRMSAGTGIQHSEYNASPTEPVHLYQIWLLPRVPGLSPTYEQMAFPAEERHNRLRLVAAPDGRDGALTIQQDVDIFLSTLDQNQRIVYDVKHDRHIWLQVLRGTVQLNGMNLSVGDGVAGSDESKLELIASTDSEMMLFDLP